MRYRQQSRTASGRRTIEKDKSIPDSLAVLMVKPMALEQGRLVKRVRTTQPRQRPMNVPKNPKAWLMHQ